MIGYAEAKRLALGCWDEVDYVTEYVDAYVFSKREDYSFGGNGPVVVLKESGRCINFISYIDGMETSEPLRMGPMTDFA